MALATSVSSPLSSDQCWSSGTVSSGDDEEDHGPPPLLTDDVRSAAPLRADDLPPQLRQRRTGEVKFFCSKVGFGFIRDRNGGGDVFLHRHQMRQASINVGDVVVYSVVYNKAGRPQARHVCRMAQVAAPGAVPEASDRTGASTSPTDTRSSGSDSGPPKGPTPPQPPQQPIVQLPQPPQQPQQQQQQRQPLPPQPVVQAPHLSTAPTVPLSVPTNYLAMQQPTAPQQFVVVPVGIPSGPQGTVATMHPQAVHPLRMYAAGSALPNNMVPHTMGPPVMAPSVAPVGVKLHGSFAPASNHHL
eukprot:TRINITY_DN27505_c2_g2_i1.p1 TRINITY_DN27505_c2_g2~~TRINITY_DN27505_c2_g2_i1.p1  ORF type:complete len:301 (+),score=68.31 TRINITY_DN27505_c2_g2_i1:187-1089(+)